MKTIVCFDLDGTLIDSSAGIYASLHHACLAEGVQPPVYEDFIPCIGPPLRDYLPTLLNVSNKKSQAILASFRTHHDREGFLAYRLYPDTRLVLAQLVERGHVLYAVTNKPFVISYAALNHFCLLERFLNVYCPDGSMLPSGLDDHKKSTILTHLRRSSDPCEIVYVGDTVSDQDAAKRANVDFICAGYGYGFGFHSEQRIDSLKGLLSLIR